jgi:hypothetical protein
LAPAASHKQSQALMDETFLLSNIIPQDMTVNGADWYSLETLSRAFTQEFSDVRVISGPLFLHSQSPYYHDETKPGHEKTNSAKDASNNKKIIQYEVIGNNNVAVPTHTFKVIFAENNLGSNLNSESIRQFPTTSNQVYAAAFVLPNRPINKAKSLTKYQIPLAELEKLSGLTFTSFYPWADMKLISQTPMQSLQTVSNRFSNSNSNATSFEFEFLDLCKSRQQACELHTHKLNDHSSHRIKMWRQLGVLKSSTDMKEVESVFQSSMLVASKDKYPPWVVEMYKSAYEEKKKELSS